jgi:hypothetical protein
LFDPARDATIPVMNGPADARRRWYGLLFLILAAGMTTWGLTLLESRLRGWGFILYWLLCLGFLSLAVVVALWDWWIIRQRRRIQQARLAREMVEKAAAEAEPVNRLRRGARPRDSSHTSRSTPSSRSSGKRRSPPLN